MGSNHGAAGFASAVEMHDALTRGGIEAHIGAGVAFMRSKGLVKYLEARGWKAFAKGYNGTAYKWNAYDTKLADAYAEWSTKLRAAPAPAAVADASTLKLGDAGPRVRALQETIVGFGIALKPDGKYGPATRRAVAAAQVELGQPGDGVASPAFVAALEAAPTIAKGAREVASKSEVKQVSVTARIGDRLRKLGWGGAGGATGYVALFNDKASTVRDGIDQARSAKETVTSLVGDGATATATAWLAEHWQALALAGGCATVAVIGGTILKASVEAYREGRLVA